MRKQGLEGNTLLNKIPNKDDFDFLYLVGPNLKQMKQEEIILIIFYFFTRCLVFTLKLDYFEFVMYNAYSGGALPNNKDVFILIIWNSKFLIKNEVTSSTLRWANEIISLLDVFIDLWLFAQLSLCSFLKTKKRPSPPFILTQ